MIGAQKELFLTVVGPDQPSSSSLARRVCVHCIQPSTTRVKSVLVVGGGLDGRLERKRRCKISSGGSVLHSPGAILVWVAVHSGCVYLSLLECVTGVALKICLVLKRKGMGPSR